MSIRSNKLQPSMDGYSSRHNNNVRNRCNNHNYLENRTKSKENGRSIVLVDLLHYKFLHFQGSLSKHDNLFSKPLLKIDIHFQWNQI